MPMPSLRPPGHHGAQHLSRRLRRHDGNRRSAPADVGRQRPEAALKIDGKSLDVGNLIDQNLSILRVDTGKSFGLAGHPAAMRGRVTH